MGVLLTATLSACRKINFSSVPHEHDVSGIMTWGLPGSKRWI